MLKRQSERDNARWRKTNVDKREAVSERRKTVSRLNPKGFLPLPLLTSRLLRHQRQVAAHNTFIVVTTWVSTHPPA